MRNDCCCYCYRRRVHIVPIMAEPNLRSLKLNLSVCLCLFVPLPLCFPLPLFYCEKSKASSIKDASWIYVRKDGTSARVTGNAIVSSPLSTTCHTTTPSLCSLLPYFIAGHNHYPSKFNSVRKNQSTPENGRERNLGIDKHLKRKIDALVGT